MRIGIDLGGTKIEGIALDESGRTAERLRVPTPRGDYAATVTAIAQLVATMESRTNRGGSVGVGIPGAISLATGLVKNANSTWIIGRPLAGDLAAALDRPVRLANDANCFALSEAIDGAAANARVVFGVIVGTGTGGGVVVDGQVLTGANAIAGEWGHNPLPWPAEDEWPGPACYCGRTGCIETFLSGPGFARDYERMSGQQCETARIVSSAASGDEIAERCLSRYEHRFGRALAGVINILDPDVIVLGGGMSNVDRLYTAVPVHWARHIFSDHVTTKLLRAKHGDSSGVRGAAWLW
jgi:fructokinase